MTSPPDDTRTGEMPLATLLRRWRLAAGLSQEALAERAGLSVNGIAQIETGKRTAPRASTLRMLADALELDAEQRRVLALAARRGSEPAGTSDEIPAGRRGPLPVPQTPLVGREAETADVLGLVRDGAWPLVTLTGPGGVGKTRLALAVAHAWVATTGHAAVWVELAALADPALVAGAVARAAAVPERPASPVIDALVDAFRDRPALLVLDNCEHLLPGAASLAAHLLERCPALRILATSRSPLRLEGERLFPVPTLALPDPHRLPASAELAAVDAVALFMQRARASRPGFALTERNATAVAEICRRLDGLPLALVLAAARMRVLSPDALLGLLEERLRLLVGGPADEHARLQTLRAAIDWSHDLLTPDQQRLFRHLGVFAGGWTLDAAAAVTGETDHIAALEGMEALVDQSLVTGTDAPEGDVRFGMLETFRAFAVEQLGALGETDDARSRHALWCLELAESLGGEVDGPRHVAAMTRLEAEHANLLHAIAWLERQGDAERMQRLAASLAPWWHAGGMLAEASTWLERALALATGHAPISAQAAALVAAGQVALLTGEFDRARAHLRAGIGMAGTHGPRDAEIAGRYWLGCAAMFQGTFEEARVQSAASLELARSGGSPRGASAALWSLGFIAMAQGDLGAARRQLAESLALAREAGSPTLSAYVLCELANLEYREGRFTAANARAVEALAMGRATGHRVTTGQALGLLAEVARAQGDWEGAARLAREHVETLRPGGVGIQLAWAIRNLAFAEMETGATGQAASRFAESLAMFRAQDTTQGIASTITGIANLAALDGQASRAGGFIAAVRSMLDDAGLSLAPADAIALGRAAEAARAGARSPRDGSTGALPDIAVAIAEALAICQDISTRPGTITSIARHASETG